MLPWFDLPIRSETVGIFLLLPTAIHPDLHLSLNAIIKAASLCWIKITL